MHVPLARVAAMPRMASLMLHKVTLRAGVAAACGLVVGHAGALTVDPAHGATVLLRPPDLTVPAGEGLGGDSPCPSGCGRATTGALVILAEAPLAQPAAPAPRLRPRAVAPAGAAPSAAAPQPHARLQLEPVQSGPQDDPVLRLSTELRSQAVADTPRREAAAALWQVLQKDPEEVLRETRRLQREIASLRETARPDAGIPGRLRAQLEQAGAEGGTSSALGAGLAALLLALVGWGAWRGYSAQRMARVSRWFEQYGESSQSGFAATGAPRAPVQDAPDAQRTAALRGPLADDAAAGAPGSEASQAGAGGAMRTVDVAELIELHDKAGFFRSIGEFERAVSMLETHVHDAVETSALAWLDLLELYHSLGRRPEYERLRSEFRQRFAADVPEFERFDQPSPSLENDDGGLGRIVASWPSRQALDAIAESLLRRQGLAGVQPFSLEAYRELVLLYHVATDLSQQDARDAQPAAQEAAPEAARHPPELARRPEPALSDFERLLVPPASARLGLDIDIGELAAQPLQPAAAEAPVTSGLTALDFDLGELELSCRSAADTPRRD